MSKAEDWHAATEGILAHAALLPANKQQINNEKGFQTNWVILYILSGAKKKNTVFFSNIIFFKPSSIFFFYNLNKGKDISILWNAYSVIHIIYCTIQAVKHYMNCIYIDSDSKNLMIFISKI